jgi:quercetin dioxygenase-like cupin family protein
VTANAPGRAGGTFLRPGGGERITDRPGRLLLVKAEHELIDVTESLYAGGEPGADPHVHRSHADGFYVLDGELALRLGPDGELCRATAGTLVLVPPGVIHSFANESSGEVRYLNLHAPSLGFIQSLRARRVDGYDPDRFDSFDPPADGGRPVSDTIVRGPGEGDPLAAGPSDILFKAGGDDGEGTLTLVEATLAPRSPGPPLHRHERHFDSFYVVEGTLTLWLGDDELEAEPGAYGFVPPGAPHTFANRSDAPVRVLYLIAPGGFERYMKELWSTTAPGEAPDPALVADLSSRYDIQLA